MEVAIDIQLLRSIESTLALDCCAFVCVQNKNIFHILWSKTIHFARQKYILCSSIEISLRKIIEMGNKSSLLLRQEEIAQIQEETGCE